MTSEEKAALSERYERAVHAMQSAVAFQANYDANDQTPKHLRVGINNALADHGSLVLLLVRKGLITEDEYLTVLVEGAESEAQSCAQKAREMSGMLTLNFA